MRTHFHRFMKRVHEEMRTLKGEKNPLTVIGKRFADEARVAAVANGRTADLGSAYPNVSRALSTAIQEALSGVKSPSEALEAAQASVE